MKHSFLKKALASLMAVCLIATMIPATAFAADADLTGASRVITGQKVDVSRPEDGEKPSQAVTDPRLNAVKTYSPDEIVTVIVMLDEPAAADYYDQNMPLAIGLDEEAMTPGKKLAAYLASDEAVMISNQNRAQQAELVSRISSLSLDNANAENGIATVANLPSQVKLVAQFTGIINAMSVKMPYGLLEQVQKMDGVKKAYVEKTYSIPDDEELAPLTGGLEKYSYAQAGVREAWEEGFTGKGMVVAVLDSALDITYDSWYDSSTGENVTGVRACHEAFREDSFMSDNSSEYVAYTKTSMQKMLNVLGDAVVAEYFAPGGNWYKNLKVPFAADYSHMDDDGRIDDNVASPDEHGTHVSGTIAGYVETEDGEVKFSGIAPDAQLLFFKVFGDDGLMTSSTPLLAALNDVAYLGADVVNLSLGSDNGFEYDDTAEPIFFDMLREFGVVASVSNGNSGNYAQNNTGTYGYALTDNPDVTMTASPAVYDNALAVASINTEVMGIKYLYWSDGTTTHKIPYSDTGSTSGYLFGEIWEGQMTEKNGIYDCGLGYPEDYDKIDWERTENNPPDYLPEDKGTETGFALVQRGTLSFSEKASNAAGKSKVDYDPSIGKPVVTKGIKGVIIYNNEPGTINMDLSDCSTTDYCPAISISMTDGEEILAAIKAGKEVTLSLVSTEDEVGEWNSTPEDPDQPGQPSSFTSWGAGPGLEFKPDIAAPGGQIFSTVPDASYNMNVPGSHDDYVGSYEYMSGTSMAAPHVSGIAALVAESLKENSAYQNLTQYDRAVLVNHLLVSTANPITDYLTDDTTFISPRIQGAGMINAGAAIKTRVYAEVTAEQAKNGVEANVGKLELMDDPDWTGSLDYAFNLVNIDNAPHTYQATMYTMTPAIDTDGERTFYMEFDRMVGEPVDLGNVTVEGHGVATMTGKVTYDPAEIKAESPNGTYIEGYIILTPVGEDIPELTVPFLGFAGDWTAPPILDALNWYDLYDENETLAEQIAKTAFIGDYGVFFGAAGYIDPTGYGYPLYLGSNPFVDQFYDEENSQYFNYGPYYSGNFAISPDGDPTLEGINYIEAYQLRDARLMLFEVTDKETGEIYYHDYIYDIPRTPFASDPYTGLLYPSPYSLYLTDMGFGYNGFKVTDYETNEIEPLPSGTQLEFKMAMFGEGDYDYIEDETGVPFIDASEVYISKPETWPTFNGHPMDMTGDIISFDLLIDTDDPGLVNNAGSITKQEDGTYLFECEFDDGVGSIADIAVYPYISYTVKEEYKDYAAQAGLPETNQEMSSTPFDEVLVFDEDANTYKYSCVLPDPAAYTEEGPYGGIYDVSWEDGVFYVFCGDYAGNDSSYVFQVDDRLTAEGEINALWEYGDLYVGDSAAITVVDNTGAEGGISYTSSDESVATVDENGVVTAVGEGTAVIVVEKAGKSDKVVITVKAMADEITDFRFSVEDFRTLRPDESIVIRAEDIIPAEFNGANAVEITDYSWEVFDPNWEYYDQGVDPFTVLVNDTPYDEYFRKEADITFNYNAIQGYAPGTTGAATLTVTLNGCTKTTQIYYEVPAETDYLISDDLLKEMTEYTDVDESVTLTARYSDGSLHQPPAAKIPFKICASSGYEFDETSWTASITIADSEGLYIVPSSVDAGTYNYTGYICAMPGYDLPETLTAVGVYRPEYDSYSPLVNSEYYHQWEYDPATGEFTLGNVPYEGAEVLIFADGVPNAESKGTNPPKGFVDPSQGGSEQTVDGLYGPFDWSVTDVNGAPVTTEYQLIENNDEKNSVTFVTSVPGVYRVTATTKSSPAAASIMALNDLGIMAIAENGKLSVTWTVIVSKPATDGSIQLVPDTTGNESIDGVNYSLVLEVGDNPEKLKLVAYDGNGNPISLPGDLIWESSNESVVTVDENGVVTVIGPGIATVSVRSASNSEVNAHYVIQVNESPIPPHTHNLFWKHSDAGHWQACVDGDYTGEMTAHSFIGSVCTVCGYMLPYARPVPHPSISADTLNIQFTIVDGEGNVIPGLSMSLNSLANVGITDLNGRALFGSVRFGNCTLNLGTTAFKFNVVSGSAFEINGTTITAPIGSTIELTLVYDGGALSFEESEDVNDTVDIDIPQQCAYAYEVTETVTDAD